MQFEIYRSMTDEQRLRIAFEMTMFARELSKAGIRRDHPDWSETQVVRELLRRALLPQPLPEPLR